MIDNEIIIDEMRRVICILILVIFTLFIIGTSLIYLYDYHIEEQNQQIIELLKQNDMEE